MKFLVVGLGSMGCRRIRLLQHISKDDVIVGVDAREDRCRRAEHDFKIATEQDLMRALELHRPDCAVISTSPVSHAKLIEMCLLAGCHVFTEINLISDGYDENILLANSNNKVLFLSSTFLYRDEITYIANKISLAKESVRYSYHVGQYLPDWHPWEKVEDFFVSDKRTNGCRELLAIELPWIIKTFGRIEEYHVIKEKISSLKVDYNDSYAIMLRHADGHVGTIHVDVVSRKAVRNLELWSENLYITWDGSSDGLYDYNIENKENQKVDLYEEARHENGYADFIVENAYENELRCFIDEVNGIKSARYSFEEDKEIIKLIDDIENIC